MKIRKSNHADGEREPFVPRDVYKNWKPAALPPRGADGGFDPRHVQINKPPKIPDATPDNMVCLRGPCRYYWALTTLFDAGNPAGTFAELGLPTPRQRHHVCMRIPGTETELTEDCVFECNQWDPVQYAELQTLERRRQAYYNAHPEYDPTLSKEATDEPAGPPDPQS